MSNNSIYLIATYAMKPKAHVNTSRAGWMKDPENIRWDEGMTVTRGLKKRDIVSGGIILNLTQRSVEKDTRKTEKNYHELFRYFFNNYNRQLFPVMAQVDPAYLQEVAAEMQAELDAQNPPETMTDAEMKAAQAEAIPDAEVVEVKDEEVKAE